MSAADTVPDTKHCNDCGTTKPAGEFGRRRNLRGGFGLAPYCRPCMRIRWKRWAGYLP